MQKDFYNKIEFTKLAKIINSDPEQARLGFEQYLEKYPMDYYARTMYASVLVRLQEFELAQKILDQTEMSSTKNGHYTKFSEKVQSIELHIFYNRLTILSHTGRFKELYEYILKHETLAKKIKTHILMLYTKKQLGILEATKTRRKGYIENQIIEYDENDMLEHVKKCFTNDDESIDPQTESIFAPDFPLEKVIKEVKENLKQENKLCYGLYDDRYIFKYNECGQKKHRKTDYFKVVCFQNTCDIITMYPTTDCEKLPYVDLNYLKPSSIEDIEKVKTISQRDKFYRRYGINNK